MKNVLLWFPRILAIVLIVFLSFFALDVFDQPQWPLALGIHLLPSFLLSAITVIAWKYPKEGSGLFFILGLFSLWFYQFEALFVSIPLIIIGGLFFLSTMQRKK